MSDINAAWDKARPKQYNLYHKLKAHLWVRRWNGQTKVWVALCGQELGKFAPEIHPPEQIREWKREGAICLNCQWNPQRRYYQEGSLVR